MSTWRSMLGAGAWIVLSVPSGCDSSAEKPGPAADVKKAIEEAAKLPSSPLTPEQEDVEAEKVLPEIAKLSRMYEAMEKAPKVLQPVDAKKLQELLPEALPDLGRTQFEARDDKYLEQPTPTAHGRYEGKPVDGGRTKSIDLSLVDMGIPTSEMAGWAHRFAGPITMEGDEGYARNYEKDGQRFYEKYIKKDRQLVLEVLVADRFLVKIDGQDASLDELKQALEKIDLKKLEALKAIGRAPQSESAAK